jgi:hypothetical protein
MIELFEGCHWAEEQYVWVGQLDNWKNLMDIANAMRFGFAKYRLPKPGVEIDVEQAQSYVDHIEKEWQREAEHRTLMVDPWKGAPKLTQLPQLAQEYLSGVFESRTPRIVEPEGFDSDLEIGF